VFGNLINSRQLKTLRSENCLFIEPFAEANLKATHYTLNPGRVLKRTPQGDWYPEFSFNARHTEFQLAANEYVVVEVRQTIKIQREGIVGRFVTTSSNIEGGLLVVAGQIDSQYGMREEALRFGVKNLMSEPNTLSRDARLAHLEFFDLRGIMSEPRNPTAAELDMWARRRRDADWEQADSDGPLPR
jgi:deoxycytidine triphosphate deaminase